MAVDLDLFEDEHQEILYISYASAGLGILGSMYIILTYIIFKDARTFGTQMVFYLSLTDLLHSLVWYPWGKKQEWCITQGLIMQFSETSSFLWALCIAFSIFQIHYQEKEEGEVKKLMPLYQICSWLLPCVLALVPLYKEKYGESRFHWCWIKDSEYVYEALLYIPCIVTFFFNATIFTMVHRKIIKYPHDFTRDLSSNMLKYTLVFLVAQLPAVVNSLQRTFQPHQPVYALYLLQATFYPLQGLLNSIAYGLNEPAFTMNYKLLLFRWGIVTDTYSIFGPTVDYGAMSPSIPRGAYDYDYNSGKYINS